MEHTGDQDNTHEGHRARLRSRYISTGAEGFAPHEILELLLTYAIPRRNVNPIAHDLLKAFGSLSGVLEATPEQLQSVPGVGENAATLLSLIPVVMRLYERSAIQTRALVKNTPQAVAFCSSLLRGKKHEQLYCVALNAQMEVLNDCQIGKGTSDEVAAYPRLAVEFALRTNAKAVILTHNHPSGNPSPSVEDIQSTRLMMAALAPLDIALCDHIIIGLQECYSMRNGGLLDSAISLSGQAAADPGGALLAYGTSAGYYPPRS